MSTPPMIDETLRVEAKKTVGDHLLPVSTYRLQFHAGFTFQNAQKIVPYLSALGISHIYASPILRARPGSTHGYDVVDPRVLNPELGTRADFDALADALSAHGMALIVDIVPNHMGVGTNDNAWWNDCLENGPASRFANYFDITWRDDSRPDMRDKILLPVLGESYGDALEQGKLKLVYDSGAFYVTYYDRRFPLSKPSYGCILSHRIEHLRKQPGASSTAIDEFEQLLKQSESPDIKTKLAGMLGRNEILRGFVAENLKTFNGTAGVPRSFDLLDDLLNRQFFRLALWRTASDEINYRRFFDINDLAALRMERAEVFYDSHALIFKLIDEGKIAGLRIDHPDGLLDPAEYFQRLQRSGANSESTGKTPEREALYVVAEKILAADEPLPRDWAVHGTTGYDYVNKLNGLFIDPASAASMTRHYNDCVSSETTFEELAFQKKRLILQSAFAGELDLLANELHSLAHGNRLWRDFTLNGIRQALGELIALFPVYRTYITAAQVSQRDIETVESAIQLAIEKNPGDDSAIYQFIGDVLLLEYPETFDEEHRAAQRHFAGKFQQLTAPVTAKGIEDTAFYIYNRLVSLNEVGGDPGRFGITPAAFHAWLGERQVQWPLGMSPLSTHDTKRSEDMRARLNVLSEFPEEWWQHVTRWTRLNEPHCRAVEGSRAPDANDEYLIYQTLIGAWPIEGAADGPTAGFITRIQEYLRKAMREAKVHTKWTDPNADYENAVMDFIAAILSVERSALFLQDFRTFQRRVSHFGLLNSLSQTVLRLTAPGVPDTYQGTELWDFSLVDPDNRRPVDYQKRQQMLAEIRSSPEASDRPKLARQLIEKKDDGRVKLFVTILGLTFRREHSELFAAGEYIPVEVVGPQQDHVFSFIRRTASESVLVIVPRFLSRLGLASELPLGEDAWEDTRIVLPEEMGNRALRNHFTGEIFEKQPSRRELRVSEVLRYFPVAMVESTGG